MAILSNFAPLPGELTFIRMDLEISLSRLRHQAGFLRLVGCQLTKAGGITMDEHTLCQRIAHGSQRALEEAIRRYSAYVVTVIHNRSQGCLRPEDEEELASDVFFALWNHAGRIHGGSLRPWLGSVARNAAISRLRTMSPTVPLDEALLPVAGSPWEAWEQTLQVQALLDCLQPDDREIFTRYYDLCQTTAEIAEALRMPPSTVRTRLSRGRALLRERLCQGG